MKKHSLIVEIATFFIIFICFVLIPFISSLNNINKELFTAWNFPVFQLLYVFYGAFILYFYYEKQKKWLFWFYTIYGFCALFCVYLFVKFFSALFPQNIVELKVELPETFITWIFCVLNFLFAAFFEEVVYRFYLSDGLYNLLSRKISGKIVVYICEAFACIVFAFAHLYMGIFAVINALFAHIILRVCYKKSGSIWPGVISHFVYNVVSLILL